MSKSYNVKWLEWAQQYKKQPLTPTLEETYHLFFEGNSAEKIAIMRDKKLDTIEKQIISLICMSMISVDDVVHKETKKHILDILEKKNPEKLSEVKSELPDTISYFDIKATLASLSAKPHRIGIDEVKRTQAKKRSFKSYG